MDEPTAVPATRIRSALALRPLSPYTLLRADPVAGATHYEFEVQDGSGQLPWSGGGANGFTLGGIGLPDWDSYRIRVKPPISPLEGDFGPECDLPIMAQPPYGLASYQLRRQDCDSWIPLNGTIATLKGPTVDLYHWEFFSDPEGTMPVAATETPGHRLALAQVPELEPGVSYWVRLRGDVGSYQGPWGGLCPIHIEAEPQ